MKVDDLINEIINKEKQITPNPFLSTRIMNRIETPVMQKVKLWQSFAVAASILLVIFTGIKTGGIYQNKFENYAAININDSEIENIEYYNSENYE